MKLLTPLAVFLGCCGALLTTAQDLKPAELLAMKKYKVTRIDSLVQAKGFKRFSNKDETEFSISMYLYQGVEGSTPVQRNLQVGLQKPIQELSLEYGLWNKADATHFIDQLISAGFKKVARSIPDAGGTGKMETVTYKKGVDEFSYNESNQSGATLYLFSISNEHYQP